MAAPDAVPESFLFDESKIFNAGDDEKQALSLLQWLANVEKDTNKSPRVRFVADSEPWKKANSLTGCAQTASSDAGNNASAHSHIHISKTTSNPANSPVGCSMLSGVICEWRHSVCLRRFSSFAKEPHREECARDKQIAGLHSLYLETLLTTIAELTFTFWACYQRLAEPMFCRFLPRASPCARKSSKLPPTCDYSAFICLSAKILFLTK